MAWGKQKRWKNKYNAVRTADGFPSKLEASVYQILKLREKAGDIKDIRRQHVVDLGYGVRWRVDFSFVDCKTGERIYAESKGVECEGYRLKRTMWKNGAGPGLLEIWKGNHTKPRLVETIEPRGYGGGLHQIDPDM